jgi:single-strand DNA-binding protein
MFRFPSINQVALSGHLVCNPEFILLETGKAVVHFRVAVNRPYRDDAGQWLQETTYVPVMILDKPAEYFAEHLLRGNAVFITGRLQSKRDEADDKVMLNVIARHIQILDKKGGAEKTDSSEPLPF